MVSVVPLKGEEGSTAFCKGHGGGNRCSFQRNRLCPKSVHGTHSSAWPMVVARGVLC